MNAEVVTFTADIGQGIEVNDAKKKAKNSVLRKYLLKIYLKSLLRIMFFQCLEQMLFTKGHIY